MSYVLYIKLIKILVFLLLGLFAGSIGEARHYKSIKQRERIFLGLPAVTSKNLIDPNAEIASSKMVYGNIVVSADYFKQITAGLKKILGGKLTAYETIMDRARREAILRMKEMASDADIIINTRIQTTAIGRMSRTKSSSTCEVLAYGTAIRYKD